MKSSLLLRSSLIAAAVGAALSANAVFITIASKGTDDYSGTYPVMHENVLSQTGGLGALSTLDYTLDGGVFGGTFTGPTDSLNVQFTLLNFVNVGNVQSGYGTWTSTGGTGGYSGTTGAGAFGVTYTFNDQTHSLAISQMDFTGEINAVPEPASFAALGVGAVALLRRRKRA